MLGETLYTGTKYFRPFPEPEDVFASDVAKHAELLLPLASVELSHLSKDWTGWLHFVAPIEPEEGVVGSEAKPYHNYLCRENWVGYHIRQGKYELATDFRFFRKVRYNEDGQPSADSGEAATSLALHYADIKTGFEAQKVHLQEYGYLHHAWAKPGFFGRYKKADRCPLVQHLGGVTGEGNWSDPADFPLGSPGNWVDSDGVDWKLVCPLTADGRYFTYIGTVSINEYVRPNADFTGMDADLLLFYDPVGQIALTTFDFS